MPKKIALDYDESELRIVVANCSGSRVQVVDAQVIQVTEGDTVSERLRAYINSNELQRTETLVAIGRGRAELRELQLPRVPEEELPDMVRFQAIRSFASASDRAIVDYLVTRRADESQSLIAAAVAPNDLDQVRAICATSQLVPKRVALRPLTAAPLYLRVSRPPNICVMIDLLNDDAEIVIAREGKVIFVRTVRLPSEDRHRSGAIAAELRRTMVACGETSTPDRIVVWGSETIHAEDLKAIRETIECEDVQAVNPFDLVSLQIDREALPEHTGRLAPLVGLLWSDEAAPETLIDFLNPRERPEEIPNRMRQILLIGGPIAAVFLLGFFVYRQFASWEQRIAAVTEEVNMLIPQAERATESIARTEQVDQFLDADVNWLDEVRRLSEKLPPSDKLILRGITGTADIRSGGGTIRLVGSVTEPSVIDEMEESLRDETHTVVGQGSQQQKGQDAYSWTFTESITLNGSDLRNLRYARMEERLFSSEPESSEPPQADGEQADAESETNADDPPTQEMDAGESADDDTTIESESDPEGEVTAATGNTDDSADGGQQPPPTNDPVPEAKTEPSPASESNDDAATPAEVDA